MKLPLWRRLELDAPKRAAPVLVPPIPDLTATIRDTLATIRSVGPVGVPAPRLYAALKAARGLSLAQFELLMCALKDGKHVKQVDWQYHLTGVQS